MDRLSRSSVKPGAPIARVSERAATVRERIANVRSCSDSLRSRLVRRALRVAFLVAALLLAIALPARAQDPDADVDTPGLIVDAVAGWDGVVDVTIPVPLSFRLRNDTQQMMQGRLRMWDPWTGRMVWLDELVLTPGSARSYRSIQNFTGWNDAVAEFVVDGRVLWRRIVRLNLGRGSNELMNSALFIDADARRLSLLLQGGESVAQPGATMVKGLQCLTAEPWQLPNHPGPLQPVRGGIFPPGAKADDLNDAQWRAAAEWVCQGAALFVHEQSAEIFERLNEFSPLPADLAIPGDGFMMRRMGLGVIYTYSGDLFASGDELRLRIARVLNDRPTFHASQMLDHMYYYERNALRRAPGNRTIVLVFFAFYALLSGGVTLLMFRMSRRKVFGYTVVVVLGASVLAGMLGGYLRFSPGDAQWQTVTHLGAGGAVQFGRFDLQSAGGRDTRLTITGKRADLQAIAPMRIDNYYGRTNVSPFAPFTWQANGSKEPNTCEIRVPITPWGRSRAQAVAYDAGYPQLEVELTLESNPQRVGGTSAPLIEGQWSVRLHNRLPMDVPRAWLVIGTTTMSANTGIGIRARQIAPQAEVSTDLYRIFSLPAIAADETFQGPLEGSAMSQGSSTFLRSTESQILPPSVEQDGTRRAWIILQLNRSPNLDLQRDRSDFTPDNGMHILMQEIHADQIKLR